MRPVLASAFVLLLATVAFAADAEPFAGVHNRLSQTADNTIANLQAPVQPAPAPNISADSDHETRIRNFAREYWRGKEDDLRRALARVESQRRMLDSLLQAEGIPAELRAVVLVESAGNVNALSRAGARGLWQFIPETARRYGLVVDASRDERLDREKSTRAAARHLRELYARFGNWPLALAAYNAGEGAVEKAVERAGTTDFTILRSLRLFPAETSRYVPAVLAAAPLFEGAQRFGPLAGSGRKGKMLYAGAVALNGEGE